MIEFGGLNWWAVLVVWLINVVIGSLWYSPLGFQKRWSKLSGVDMMKIPQAEANRAIGFVAGAAAIQSLVLAVVINSLHITRATNGFEAGFVLWLGLTAATTIGNTLYSRLSLRFWWLNASFFLVVMTAGSVILAVWK